MKIEIAGTFEVRREPRAPLDGDPPGFGRFVFHKTFHGDLAATGHVEMTMVSGGVPGSAAYVALERVIGALVGREGTFVLVHRGIMNRGVGGLLVEVAPDTGTDALTGLSGTMTIRVDGGVHHYTFDGVLPD